MQANSDLAELPPAIDGLLRRYVRRRRLLALAKSVGVSVAIFLMAMLVVCLIDRLFPLHRSVRIFALSIDLLVAATIIIRPLVALRRKLDPVRTAVSLEDDISVFDQRLVTVVSQTRDQQPFVEQLRDEVAILATLPDSCPRVSLKPLARPWTGTLVMSLVILLLTLSPRLQMGQLLTRFVHPLADISPATATRLAVRPGSMDVLEGRSLTIAASVQSSTNDIATLHLSDDGRTWTTWPMPRPPHRMPASAIRSPRSTATFGIS